MPERADDEVTHPKAWDVFAAAYADASNPVTFASGVESYLAAYPHVERPSAKSAATRLLRQPKVQELIEACRQANRTAAGLTAAEFIRRGWEVFNDLSDAAMFSPKLASALPNLYVAVGKAAGFIIERSQSKVEVTERHELPTPEAMALAEEAFARFRRLNEPNVLPQATATALLHSPGADPVAEADFEVMEVTTDAHTHEGATTTPADDASHPAVAGREGEAVSDVLVEREPNDDRPDGA